MRRFTIGLLAVVVAMAIFMPAPPAQADIISFNGFQTRGFKVKGTLDHHQVGAFQTGDFDITWNEKDMLSAYCMSMLKVGVGGQYLVSSLGDLAFDSKIWRAAWIMDNYSPGLGFSSDHYSDRIAATAVQSALWTLSTPYTTHPFTLTKVYAHDRDRKLTMELYANLLSESSQVDFNTYTFKHQFYFGKSLQNRQNLLFAGGGGGSTVPEPGTMLLFGSALGMGVWFRRRKKA